MIKLDGSHGEGGGAILRTALALSTITGEPFTIDKIRANRPVSGLKAQHVETIRAFTTISSGTVQGATPGSKTLAYHPGNVSAGTCDIRIGTAGSVTLVLQALLPAIAHSKKKVTLRIRGGTDVKWSPSWDYMRQVLFPLLEGVVALDAKLVKRGYFPTGGGLVTVTAEERERPRPIRLEERGTLTDIRCSAHAAAPLRVRNVSERIAASFAALHPNTLAETSYAVTTCLGAGITAWATFANTVLGVDLLGDEKTHSEMVGERAGKALLDELAHGAPMDRHMADMIPLYLAIYGGSVRLPVVTKHVESNLHVIEQFMPGRLKREGLEIYSA